jgi:hypothetical protein
MKLLPSIGIFLCVLGFSWLRAMEGDVAAGASAEDLLLNEEEYGVLIETITAQKGLESFSCDSGTRNLKAVCECVFAVVSPTQVTPTSASAAVEQKYWEIINYYNVMQTLCSALAKNVRAGRFIQVLGKLRHAAHMQIHQFLSEHKLDSSKLYEKRTRVHQGVPT